MFIYLLLTLNNLFIERYIADNNITQEIPIYLIED